VESLSDDHTRPFMKGFSYTEKGSVGTAALLKLRDSIRSETEQRSWYRYLTAETPSGFVAQYRDLPLKAAASMMRMEGETLRARLWVRARPLSTGENPLEAVLASELEGLRGEGRTIADPLPYEVRDAKHPCITWEEEHSDIIMRMKRVFIRIDDMAWAWTMETHLAKDCTPEVKQQHIRADEQSLSDLLYSMRSWRAGSR